MEQPRDVKSIKSLKPLGFSRDGDRVLLEHDRSKLCWYNLKNEDEGLSWVRIPGMPNSIEGTPCVGSLVPPALLSRKDDINKHKLGDEKTRKKR